jgi:hypothetical protein
MERETIAAARCPAPECAYEAAGAGNAYSAWAFVAEAFEKHVSEAHGLKAVRL